MRRILLLLALLPACADGPLPAGSETDGAPLGGPPLPGATPDAGLGHGNPPGKPYAPGEDPAGEDDPLDADRDTFCLGEGPILEIGDRELVRETCAGDLAETVFTNALCTCEDTRLAGYLLTRGFDSREGPAPDDEGFGGGAPVGMNGTYAAGAGYTRVGGSLSVAGPADLTFVGYLDVRGDLRLAGNALVPGYTRVARDAWFGGDFTGATITVERDLRHRGNLLTVPNVGGRVLREAVSVEPPCPCDAPVNVRAILDRVRGRNDNAAIGLDPAILRRTVGATRVELPCGRFYLDEISGVGDLRVLVTGRVVLAVGGPIAALGNLQFELAADAELDLFVQGPLGQIGNVSFGDRDRPAATRIYVAGADDIVLVGASAFVGNLYAPHARVTSPGFIDAYGSFFVRALDAAGFARISYDRAITELDCDEDVPPGSGETPPEDPPPGVVPDVPCQQCNWCRNGLACADDGFCRPCAADADCCGQLVCEAGRCVNLDAD